MRFHGLVQGPIDNKLMWRQSSKPFERISHAENSRWTHEHRKHKKRTVVKVFKIDKSFFFASLPYTHVYCILCVYFRWIYGYYFTNTHNVCVCVKYKLSDGTRDKLFPRAQNIAPNIAQCIVHTHVGMIFFLFVSSIDNISGTDGFANNHIYFSFIRYFDATISSVKTC